MAANTESWLKLHGFNKEDADPEDWGHVPENIDVYGCSNITKKLIKALIERDKLGKAKYGTSLDRTDLTHEQWLDHMTEELLDAAGYAQSAKRAL